MREKVDPPCMNKRLISAGLWFIAAVYAGSILHGIAGINELAGPLFGLMSASLIVADPFRRLTARPVVAPRPTSPAAGAMQTQV